MRTLLVKNDSLEMYFTLNGIDCSVIKSFDVGATTVAIDESFPYDITMSFPKYILAVFNILETHNTGRFDKISGYNTREVYNKPVDKSLINDITILLRKDDYNMVNIPYVMPDGSIKISTMSLENARHNTLETENMIDRYWKIRTLVFNTTVLPYIKRLASRW